MQKGHMPASHADPDWLLPMACPGSDGQRFLLIVNITESMNLLKPAGSATNQVGMLR